MEGVSSFYSTTTSVFYFFILLLAVDIHSLFALGFVEREPLERMEENSRLLRVFGIATEEFIF